MSFTTRQRVKQLLNIPATLTDADGLVDVLVDVSNNFVLEQIGLTSPDSTSYNETLDVDWDYTTDLMLTHTPVISITSVTMGGTVLDSGDYYVSQVGSLRLKNSEQYFSFGRQIVTVVYNAGFSTIPEQLKHAATLICVSMYNKNPKAGFMSERTGSYSYMADRHTIPPIARSILDRYRRVFARAR